MFSNLIVDIIILSILLFGLSYGFDRGLIKMVSGPTGIIIPTVIGLSFSEVFSRGVVSPFLFSLSENNAVGALERFLPLVSLAISFSLLFLISRLLLKFLLSVIDGIFSKGIFGIMNRFVGGSASCVISFIIVSFLVSLLGRAMLQSSLIDVEFLNDFEGGPIFRFFLNIANV